MLKPGFVGYKVIMGLSCFLWCFVYIIFISLFKIRCVNRLSSRGLAFFRLCYGRPC